MSNDINLVGFKRNHSIVDLELNVGGTQSLFWMDISDLINNIHQDELVVPFISGYKIAIMKDTDVDGDDHFTACIVKPDGTFHSMGERIEEVVTIQITHRVIPGSDELEIYVVKLLSDDLIKTNMVPVKLSDLTTGWTITRGLDNHTKILVSKNKDLYTITLHERAYEIDSKSGNIKALGNRLDGVCYEFNLGDLDPTPTPTPNKETEMNNGDTHTLLSEMKQMLVIQDHRIQELTSLVSTLTSMVRNSTQYPQQGFYPNPVPQGFNQTIPQPPAPPNGFGVIPPMQSFDTKRAMEFRDYHSGHQTPLDQMHGLNQRVTAQQQPTATKEGIKDQAVFWSNFLK